MPHERPANAKNDYWMLTDDDLQLAIEDVRRCMRQSVSTQSLWSVSYADSPNNRLQSLLNLRTEQLRRLTTEDSTNAALDGAP